jgi:hypothetical protein
VHTASQNGKQKQQLAAATETGHRDSIADQCTHALGNEQDRQTQLGTWRVSHHKPEPEICWRWANKRLHVGREKPIAERRRSGRPKPWRSWRPLWARAEKGQDKARWKNESRARHTPRCRRQNLRARRAKLWGKKSQPGIPSRVGTKTEARERKSWPTVKHRQKEAWAHAGAIQIGKRINTSTGVRMNDQDRLG